MTRIRNTFLLLLFLTTVISCRQQQPGTTDRKNEPASKEELVAANKILVKRDAAKIAAFVKRRNWEMKETETGLWYMIYEKGKGKQALVGDIATINYSISLLDGTACYSSDTRGPKEFRIGQGGVESGLEEGILLLHTGDKARFIMPPHLAHGLLGDNDKIPARAILLYEVELIAINGK